MTGRAGVVGGNRGVGSSELRPDGAAKVGGAFAYAGDLRVPGMLHARTLRSPHPRARIGRVDTAAARRLAGVLAVVTAADVPGVATYGLISADQPVFAATEARYAGEPVAAVAAVDAATARRALAAIRVAYEPLPPLVDPGLAAEPGAELVHPDGNIYREITLTHGNPSAEGPVAVEDSYFVGMQDQAFLAPEAALVVPAADGGLDLRLATQWLHSDREQIAACLGLPESLVRLELAGVGGAFGGREDVTLQIHGALLALATGRPVRIAYDRVESFLGHPHRHPARMWFRHTATAAGDLVSVHARILMDGGAYTSSSPAVLANAVTHAAGPYRVPNAQLDGTVVRTNNPPCGAMRGFGVPQVAFGHEAQMDRLADLLGLHPVALRTRNALRPGDVLPTGQILGAPLPAREAIEAVAARPLPPPLTAAAPETALPGGRATAATHSRVRRGIGFALGYKNLLFSEGFDDASTARARLALDSDGVPFGTVHSACSEVGQGFVTVAGQIARTELGVERIELLPADTGIGSAGSTSASRQTWMSGGAVHGACVAVVDRLLARVARSLGLPPEVVESPRRSLVIDGGEIIGTETGTRLPLAEALADGGPVEAEYTFHHRRTTALDARGQGDPHVAFAAAAHRAVVDVDLDLGLVRVVAMALAQDCGTVINPLSLRGQVEGGTAQGLGLAVMEELVTVGGVVTNPTLHDYLLPTAADVPALDFVALTYPQPGAPYGVKGVGEAPTCTATAAVVAAIRDAVGRDLRRVPVRPVDLVDLSALADPAGR
ncbi:xanthine dehydrogenase subunit D [Parafrankia colletiae]|uniref:Xanthine dehydrogenase subunit D n=1 Tax=Parafrankia colletiae TaxID=573497 RepID=A0A1S1QI43_9ACTN|nr:xanthine dehydrogenase subunit D [Parafrankia colletiae]MCK9900030.1 xanthine dehydrogenase subunit D [Frankia sp. Cpl3]OHV31974.1 xanthine dehydrogenase subunit D [Parafrankia colletiae]